LGYMIERHSKKIFSKKKNTPHPKEKPQGLRVAFKRKVLRRSWNNKVGLALDDSGQCKTPRIAMQGAVKTRMEDSGQVFSSNARESGKILKKGGVRNQQKLG
jgi:hypothetical protein